MPQKGSKKLLLVLFAAAFIAAFNENIVNVGLANIMEEFSISATMANWLVTGYMIVTAIVVTTIAFLLKRFNLRPLFFIGSGAFIAGCVFAYVAPSFPLLLASRLLQAVGTGVFIPMMMNSVLVVAPRKQLGVYLAVGACCITFGPAFGPVVSGLMVTLFGWRTMFFVPLAIMVLILIAGTFCIKNINETQHAKLDIVSVLLSAVGLTALVFGLSGLIENTVPALVSLAIGVLVLALFALRQTKLSEPLLNLEPLRNPRFALASVLVVVAMMTTFSMSVLLPLYFVGAAGTTALLAGALVLIPILAQAAFAFIGGKVLDRFGEWPLLPIGFLLITVGQVAVCLVSENINLVAIVAAAALVYAGVGLSFSPSQTAGLRKLPAELNASGVAIMSAFIQIAAALGPSLFVGVLSSVVVEETAFGEAVSLAQAHGFSAAIAVAAVIAAVGCVIAFFYARKIARKRQATPVGVLSHEGE